MARKTAWMLLSLIVGVGVACTRPEQRLADLEREIARHRERGELAGAVEAAGERARLRAELLGADAELVASDLEQLGALTLTAERWADAEAAFREALRIRELRTGADQEATIASVEGLARALDGLERYPEAEPLHRRVIAARTAAFGPYDLRTAAAWFQLGEHFTEAAIPEEAVESHRKALAIREQQLPADHDDLAASLHGLGDNLRRLEPGPEAEGYLRRAMAIDGVRHGKKSGQYAADLEAVGRLARDRDEYDRAEPLLLEALEIRRARSGPATDASMAVTEALVMLYSDMDRDEDAARVAREGIAILDAAGRPASDAALALLRHLALAAERSGQLAEAESAHRLLVALRSESGRAESGKALGASLELARFLQRHDRCADAVPLAAELANRLGAAPRPNLEWLGASQNLLAVCLASLGSPTEAEILYLAALDSSAAAEDVTTESRALRNLDVLYGETGEVAKAVTLKERAVAIAERHGDEARVARELRQLARLYDHAGEKEKAADAWARALERLSRHAPLPLFLVQLDGDLSELRRRGLFGLPAETERTTVDRSELTLAIYNDRRWLFVQAILWSDPDDTIEERSDGFEEGDSSALHLDVLPEEGSPRTLHRVYHANAAPLLPGASYQDRTSEGLTPLRHDTRARTSIRYVQPKAGRPVRVDTFLVPLAEIAVEGKTSFGLLYEATSPHPRFAIDSAGWARWSTTPVDVPIAFYRRLRIRDAAPREFPEVPDGRSDRFLAVAP